MADRTLGVLDLQGDVEAHVAAFARLGLPARRVKTAAALREVHGLVIPGGESSTVGMLLVRFGLMRLLRERIGEGLCVFGTCTGLILMAREIEGSRQERIGCLDVSVLRNAYGRQVDSFEEDLDIPVLGTEPMRAVYIRAPRITRIGPEVEVLARSGDVPVAVRQGRLLGASFHPELTHDDRMHRYFQQMVTAA